MIKTYRFNKTLAQDVLPVIDWRGSARTGYHLFQMCERRDGFLSFCFVKGSKRANRRIFMAVKIVKENFLGLCFLSYLKDRVFTVARENKAFDS